MKRIFILLLLASAFIFGTQRLFANVRLPSIIGSHMVLQQNTEVTIWGWSDAMEKVKVIASWDTTTYKVTGSRNANWSIKIKTPKAGGPYNITISGYNTTVLEDVLVGEVWLCSGQSNMEWSVNATPAAQREVPLATNQNLRLFKINRVTSDFPQDDLPGQWVVCNPEDVKHFSAIGYFFGKKIQQQLGVPVGIISSSWGGTPAETWTPKDIVQSDVLLKEAEAKNSGSYPGWPYEAGKTYNAMINPLINFSIAGVLWYQGESNTATYATYQPLLTAMIGSWRKAWNKVFPFYIVQIAPYQYGNENIGVLLREAQTKSLSNPKTGMVVISDLVDDVNDIHPKNKIDVAYRLANLALGDTYGKSGITYKYPMYKGMEIEKNKIRISFSNADAGLISKTKDLTEFYIAGDDKKFLPAVAKIEGNTIVVWNKDIKSPLAVRFGFKNDAIPNLFSKEGLPVNLFRTDDWAVTTDTVR